MHRLLIRVVQFRTGEVKLRSAAKEQSTCKKGTSFNLPPGEETKAVSYTTEVQSVGFGRSAAGTECRQKRKTEQSRQ